MGEVYYIWADTNSAREQIALSSFVLAMEQKEMVAVIRMITGDGRDAKMGIGLPRRLENVDCLLWVQVRLYNCRDSLGLERIQMPFAEDYRKYSFKSLERLQNKKGELVTDHPSLATPQMLEAMDDFVDSMDLTEAAKDDEG